MRDKARLGHAVRRAAVVALAAGAAACAWPLAALAQAPEAPAVKGGPGELPRKRESNRDAEKPRKRPSRPAMPIEPAPKDGSMKLGAKPAKGKLGEPPARKGPIGSPPTHKSDEGGPPRPR